MRILLDLNFGIGQYDFVNLDIRFVELLEFFFK